MSSGKSASLSEIGIVKPASAAWTAIMGPVSRRTAVSCRNIGFLKSIGFPLVFIETQKVINQA
jgi:hypothetical protein